MLLESIAKFDRSARRLQEILTILAKYGLADWLGGVRYEWLQSRFVSPNGVRLNSLTQPARIRLAITELGPTFIKFGQILSTRADLLPEPLIEELCELQANTPPDPPDVVRRVIESELGHSIDEIFEDFEDTCIASASVAQVHRARLRTGQEVAVKVQHDGIEERIHSDLQIMAGLAELLEKHVADFRIYKPTALVRHFRRTLLQELDFNSERRNVKFFINQFAHEAAVRFPIVYSKLSSRRVLTMELLKGIPGTNHDELARSGADLNEFAERAGQMYVRMIFRDGVYHADPHPGNYIRLPGNVVGVVDCGMVGRLDDSLREDLESLILTIVEKDSQELTNMVIRIGSPPATLDYDGLRTDASEFVSRYVQQPLKDLELSSALNEMIEIIRRYQIVLPAEAAMLLRTLVILEGSARQLSPQFNLLELIQKHYRGEGLGRLLPQHLVRRLRSSYRDWSRLAVALPGDLSDILRRFRNGSLEIHHEHRRLESTLNHLVVGILAAALFLGSANLLGHATPPLIGGVSVIGALGLLAAVSLGSRLLLVIRRENLENRPK